MNNPLQSLTTGVLLLAMLMLGSTVSAAPREGRDYDVSKRDAARIVKDRYGGRVLDVRPGSEKARPGYRVKVLDKGRVKVLGVDARTGEIRE